MGGDAHSAAVNAVNGPAIHRRPPMIFNFKKTVAMDTSRPLRSASSNLHSDIAFSYIFVLFPIHITLL